MAANDAPDVITMGGAYPAEYANRGALLDLAKVSGSLDLSGIDEGSLQNGQVQGKQYGISTGANALAAVVNPAVFQAAGVALPDDETWTWEDFARVAAEVTARSPEGTFGTASVLSHDSLDAFARQRGESLYTKDGQLGLGKETVQEYFGYSLKLSGSGAAPSASETVERLDASTEQTLMGMGRAAMMLTWSNPLTALSKAGMRSAIQDLLTPQGKAEAAYIDEIGKLKFAPTFIGPAGSTAVAEITSRINTEVLFKRLTPEKGAEQWISESKAAIGK